MVGGCLRGRPLTGINGHGRRTDNLHVNISLPVLLLFLWAAFFSFTSTRPA
jgi:hypothetical protein